MRDKYLHHSRSVIKQPIGTNGLLLGCLIGGVILISYHTKRIGLSLADLSIVLAFVSLLISRRKIPDREMVFATTKPIIIGIYCYILVALLPTLSGGGFISIQLVKDVFSFSILPITYITIARVIDPRRITRAITLGLYFSIAIISFTVLSSSALRTGGLMSSPNTCGNWAAMCAILLFAIDAPKNLVIRSALAGLLVAVTFSTASVGGLLGLIGTLAYWAPRRLGKVSVANQVVPILIAGISPVILQAFDSWTGLNRYQRSSQGRFSIWGDALKTWFQHPLGLGIGNFNDKNLELAVAPEAHNDYVSSLVELGILGPLAIGFICFAIFRVGGLRARTMTIFYLVSAVSHNSINFRHIWVFTAICLAYDTLPQLQSTSGSDADAPKSPKKSMRSNMFKRKTYKFAQPTLVK